MELSVSAEQCRQLREAWAYQGAVRAVRLMALSFSTLGLMLGVAALGFRGKGLSLFFGAAFIFMLAGVVVMFPAATALTMLGRKVFAGSETTPFERASLLRGMVIRDAFYIRRMTA